MKMSDQIPDRTRCTTSDSSDPDPGEVFIARQPIFDPLQKVHAYELLFRSSRENRFDGTDADLASLHTVNNVMHLTSMTALAEERPVFINFTRRLLLEETFKLLPKQKLVVEVLEDVEPDADIIAACRRIKEAGYRLALDDCIFADRHNPLWGLADIVKVDFMQCSGPERRELGRRCRDQGIEALAEKVETVTDFNEAREAGYHYFQGYFFCRPQLHASRDLRTDKVNCLRFIRLINMVEPDVAALEMCIKQDASLSYKLLRYLNSAAMGLTHKVSSIHQALMLLGIEPLRKWGTLVAMTGLAADKPHELLATCLVRAHFCERMGPAVAPRRAEGALFIMGLLSGLHAMLDRPMREVLQDVAVDDDIRNGLLDRNSALGRLHQLVLACERGHWERVAALTGNLKVDPAFVARTYHEAITDASREMI